MCGVPADDQRKRRLLYRRRSEVCTAFSVVSSYSTTANVDIVIKDPKATQGSISKPLWWTTEAAIKGATRKLNAIGAMPKATTAPHSVSGTRQDIMLLIAVPEVCKAAVSGPTQNIYAKRDEPKTKAMITARIRGLHCTFSADLVLPSPHSIRHASPGSFRTYQSEKGSAAAGTAGGNSLESGISSKFDTSLSSLHCGL